MVNNHDEKAKDMAESVLPSAARKSARTERRRVHRAQRARQRVSLAKFDPVAVDDFTPDFREGRRRSAIQWMVFDRRSADKIGPLTRWAIARVRADRDLRDAGLDIQVEHFARLFPDNLIGRHAVQHIELALRYEATRHQWRGGASLSAKRREEHRAWVASRVRRLIGSGCHGALNGALRRHYQLAEDEVGKPGPPCPARYLLGTHDVEAFAAEVASDLGVRTLIAELTNKIG